MAVELPRDPDPYLSKGDEEVLLKVLLAGHLSFGPSGDVRNDQVVNLQRYRLVDVGRVTVTTQWADGPWEVSSNPLNMKIRCTRRGRQYCEIRFPKEYERFVAQSIITDEDNRERFLNR